MPRQCSGYERSTTPLDAWRGALPGGLALRAFVDHWTVPGFANYVPGAGHLQSRLRKAPQAQRVCDLEGLRSTDGQIVTPTARCGRCVDAPCTLRGRRPPRLTACTCVCLATAMTSKRQRGPL